MGEKKEKIKAIGVEKKNEAGEKSAGGGKNDAGGGIATILLKLDLHCEGCAKKVRRCVRHFEGVEDVKADSSTGKLTVKGNVDPLWLREKVEIKTKKKVALLSDQPKKVIAGTGDGDGEEKKSDEKVENKKVDEKKVEDKKPKNKKVEEKKVEDKKPKKVQCNREVVGLHCYGSAQNIKRFIIKKLKPYLKYNSKRNVAVVPPKKGDRSGGQSHNKKKKEVARGDGGGGGDGDGGRKKEDGESTRAVASKSTEPKEQKTEMVNNKKEYYSSNPNMYYAMPPMYNQSYSNQDYGVTMYDHGYYGHSTGYVPALHDHGYGYSTGYVPPPYTAPEYFSDENPNACSVM